MSPAGALAAGRESDLRRSVMPPELPFMAPPPFAPHQAVERPSDSPPLRVKPGGEGAEIVCGIGPPGSRNR